MARTIDTEGYEAAKDLVTELLRTSLTLQDLFVNLVEELPEDAFPGEDPGEVLLEMIPAVPARWRGLPGTTSAGRRPP